MYVQIFDFLVGMQYIDKIWVPSLRTASLYGAGINHAPRVLFCVFFFFVFRFDFLEQILHLGSEWPSVSLHCAKTFPV